MQLAAAGSSVSKRGTLAVRTDGESMVSTAEHLVTEMTDLVASDVFIVWESLIFEKLIFSHSNNHILE